MAPRLRTHSLPRKLPTAALLVLLASATGGNPAVGADPRVDLDLIDCVIEPNMTVELGSPAEGVVETVAVDRSDIVHQGQVLVKLESRVENAAVAVARTRARMTGELKARKASLGFERRLAARADALFDAKTISPQEKDQTSTNAAVAELQLQQSKEAKRLAELELWRAKEIMQRRTILSPIDGVVVERMVSPGELVDDEPILKLAQIDPLRVEAIVPALLFGSIQTGNVAEVTPEPPGAGVHTATVVMVDRIIDAASGTFRVRAELPNPDFAIPAGLRCKIRILPQAAASPARSR